MCLAAPSLSSAVNEAEQQVHKHILSLAWLLRLCVVSICCFFLLVYAILKQALTLHGDEIHQAAQWEIAITLAGKSASIRRKRNNKSVSDEVTNQLLENRIDAQWGDFRAMNRFFF